MPVFLDTNILLYSISVSEEDSTKRDRAAEILTRADCVLSVQVLHEFYAQATRESRKAALRDELAVGFIQTWRRFPVQENTLALLDDAFSLKGTTGFSLWDCLIVAAACAARCGELLTEDLSHGRVVSGVRIVNPFL